MEPEYMDFKKSWQFILFLYAMVERIFVAPGPARVQGIGRLIKFCFSSIRLEDEHRLLPSVPSGFLVFLGLPK